jgi:serine/threonine protein kinase
VNAPAVPLLSSRVRDPADPAARADAAETRPGFPRRDDVVAGKYCIERVVAEGGMGVVYAAHHIALDQRVALKVLIFDAHHGHEHVERFVREARAAARLRSEHVVRVTDAGALDCGAPFLVMEYLQGCDLAELLRLEGPLPPADVADYALQALAALAQAHAAGIVHRDLKPANLFLAVRDDGSNVLKVLDFGISKQTSQNANWKELTGKAVLGTPYYMSPEQLRSSKNVDVRADIWSLGVVLYELLSGRVPFDGDGPGEIFSAVLEGTPVPIRDLRPELSRAWGEIVGRCLERSLISRYQDVAELARAIAPLGSGRWGHLLSGVEGVLAPLSEMLPLTDLTLIEAADAAAARSLPPPRSSTPAIGRGIHSSTFMTGKTLGAEVVSARHEPATRRRALGMRTAIGVAVAGVLITALASSARRASHGDATLAARPAESALPGLVAPRPGAPSGEPESRGSVVPEPAAQNGEVDPLADGSPASAATSASAPPPLAPAPRRVVPAGSKPAAPARPEFLKSWR